MLRFCGTDMPPDLGIASKQQATSGKEQVTCGKKQDVCGTECVCGARTHCVQPKKESRKCNAATSLASAPVVTTSLGPHCVCAAIAPLWATLHLSGPPLCVRCNCTSLGHTAPLWALTVCAMQLHLSRPPLSVRCTCTSLGHTAPLWALTVRALQLHLSGPSLCVRCTLVQRDPTHREGLLCPRNKCAHQCMPSNEVACAAEGCHLCARPQYAILSF